MPAQELSLGITLAVLGAGLLHASWNAMLKSAPGGDPMLDTASVVAGSSVCALVLLPFAGVPGLAAWKFIAGSSAVHFAYYITLAHAYRTGDLSFAYPLMRGTAPLLVTVLGIVFLHELPTTHVAAGIVLICAGIVSIAFVRRDRHPPAAAAWAFANAAIIAVYTLIDGGGARASGDAIAYVTWLIFLEGLPFLAWIAWRRGRPATRDPSPRRRPVFCIPPARRADPRVAFYRMAMRSRRAPGTHRSAALPDCARLKIASTIRCRSIMRMPASSR